MVEAVKCKGNKIKQYLGVTNFLHMDIASQSDTVQKEFYEYLLYLYPPSGLKRNIENFFCLCAAISCYSL